jgi:hypothetical protein
MADLFKSCQSRQGTVQAAPEPLHRKMGGESIGSPFVSRDELRFFECTAKAPLAGVE